MRVLNKYAQMRGNKDIGPAALQAFRAENDLFRGGRRCSVRGQTWR